MTIENIKLIKHFTMKAIFKLMAAIAIYIAAQSCACTVIDNSEVGIKFNKFGITEQGRLEAISVTGYVFYNPFVTSVFSYPTYVQRKEYNAFHVNTKDGAEFYMDPTLAYYINRSQAQDIFTTYRTKLSAIEEGYMRTAIYEAYRICANKYTSDELMANRAQFESDVRSMVDKSLCAEGFVVKEFTSKIDPPKSLQAAIDAKNQAIQAALKAENEIKAAEAQAKINVAKAEGDAKAMKIKADAEAYYNRTIAASLSPMIVQEDWIEKWDGKLPMYSGSGTPLINMPK